LSPGTTLVKIPPGAIVEEFPTTWVAVRLRVLIAL
jgi:hypothetical protein